MENKSKSTVLLLIILLISTPNIVNASVLQNGLIQSLSGEVAHIIVTATSPHVANGTDFSKVAIYATDVNGTPVSGAEIIVRKNQGEDDEKFFTTIDHGNGTYTAQVNSTISGAARIWAIDNMTGLMEDCTVYFDPGPLAEVDLTVTNPREGFPKNTSEVIVTAVDAFNNIINSSRCALDVATDLGTVGLIEVDEYGIFRTTIVSNDLGIANITATAYDLAYGLTCAANANVTFPTIYFYAPQDAYTVCTTFMVPVNIYIFDPARALGYYNLEFTFNSSVIQFLNASDGDPYDEFEAPEVSIGPCGSSIKISQQNKVSMISPTGSVDITNLTFKAVREGYTDIGITFPTIIKDTKGVPISVTPPKPPICPVTVKKPPMKKICLNILVMLDADGKTWACDKKKITDQITFARLVYGVYNLKCCCNIFIEFCGPTTIPHDPKLFKTCNDTALAELLNKYKKSCCLTVIYIKEYCKCSATALTLFKPCTNTSIGIIMTCKSCESTLAHELGHALLGFHSGFDDHKWCFKGKEAPKDNVMYPSHLSTGHLKNCKPINKWKLTHKQIDRIMRCNNPLLKWVKTPMPCDYYKRLQNVSISGFGFVPLTYMDVYLIPNGVNFSRGNEIAMTTVVTDENGTFPDTYIWTADKVGYYDIWVDYDRNGIAAPGEYITYEEVRLYRITVSWLGDCDIDFDIDEDDLWYFCAHFITYHEIHWKNPLCDFDEDCDIDEDDLWIFCGAFIDYYRAT